MVGSARRALSLKSLVAEDHARPAELLLDRGDAGGACELVCALAALAPGHPAVGPLRPAIERVERKRDHRDDE